MNRPGYDPRGVLPELVEPVMESPAPSQMFPAQQAPPPQDGYRAVVYYSAEPPVPDVLKRWNWGAFVFTWIWGLANHCYLAFLAAVPGFGIAFDIYLGIMGTRWAWQYAEEQDMNRFLTRQAAWNAAGLAVFIAGCVLAVLGVFAFLLIGVLASRV